MFRAPRNCSFGSHNIYDHEFTLKILFGNLYIELRGIKISFLHTKSIMKDIIIEGFGGKRALGFLLRIELCRKRSKFHMQFCLGALNNALYVFFAEVFFVYEILRMQKSLYLWSHQHVTGKTVISLKIQQNIDLLQRVTLKSVDFRVKPLQF